MAQLASASGLGPEGPVFESQYPDIQQKPAENQQVFSFYAEGTWIQCLGGVDILGTPLALFLKNKALQLGLKCHIFCELLHFLLQLDLFPFAVRSLLRLAEIFCPWHMSISEGCRSDDFHCHSKSSDHSVEDGDTWDYHTVFYTGNI